MGALSFFYFYTPGIYRSCQSRRRRIAGLLPSYKRFKDLKRQIWRLMDLNTEDFHLFVAVKGMAEADSRRLLLPQFSHFWKMTA